MNDTSYVGKHELHTCFIFPCNFIFSINFSDASVHLSPAEVVCHLRRRHSRKTRLHVVYGGVFKKSVQIYMHIYLYDLIIDQIP